MNFSPRNRHRELAGIAFEHEVDRAYSDRAFTFASLKSTSWKRRYVALTLLVEHWGIDAEILVPVCKFAVENDDEVQVRQNALRLVGDLHKCSFDAAISQYLAAIVLDESKSNRIRRSAYEALEKVRLEVSVAREFKQFDFDEMLELFEELKSEVKAIKSRDPDAPFEFDVELMRELTR